MIEYKKKDGESDELYALRICMMKEQIGTWQDVANIINQETNNKYDESAYRKKYQAYAMLSALNDERKENTDYLEELKKQKREIMEETVKLRDERNELNRLYREKSRHDSFKELVSRVALKIPYVDESCYRRIDGVGCYFGDTELVVHLTDIHAGQKIDTFAEHFDMDILRIRMQRYVDKIIDIANRHNSNKCTVILGGDLINGIIHNSARIENNENVVEQTIQVSMAISNMVAQLSMNFSSVDVYGTPGNHSRIMQNKREQLTGEYLDNFVIYYIKSSLQAISNVKVITENKYHESLGSCKVCDSLIYFSHGDKDSPESVVQRMTMLTGVKPDIILLGHRHTNAMTTVYDTKVIESGSFKGADNYCIEHRLRNRPEQCVLVMNENGMECLYDIQLDR